MRISRIVSCCRGQRALGRGLSGRASQYGLVVGLATSLYEIVLALHIMAVVVAFGVTFAYPIMFAVGARQDPRSLPVLHRIEYTAERILVNGGLVIVMAAGIFLASDGHRWSEFFVQWGLGVSIVIGGLVGGVMIPTAKRAEEVARRDLATGDLAASARDLAAGAGAGASGSAAAGGAPDGAAIEMSGEYRALVRRLSIVGGLLSALVLVTILIMVTAP
jgi:hypothetical protein